MEMRKGSTPSTFQYRISCPTNASWSPIAKPEKSQSTNDRSSATRKFLALISAQSTPIEQIKLMLLIAPLTHKSFVENCIGFIKLLRQHCRLPFFIKGNRNPMLEISRYIRIPSYSPRCLYTAFSCSKSIEESASLHRVICETLLSHLSRLKASANLRTVLPSSKRQTLAVLPQSFKDTQ